MRHVQNQRIAEKYKQEAPRWFRQGKGGRGSVPTGVKIMRIWDDFEWDCKLPLGWDRSKVEDGR